MIDRGGGRRGGRGDAPGTSRGSCSTGGSGARRARSPGRRCGRTWRGCRPVVRGLLAEGAACGCAADGEDVPRAAGGLRATSWTFAAVAGVEPTNNAAERALRHGVIWREVQRRDRQRGGEPVRRADADGGGDLPAAGPRRARLPHGLPAGPARRHARTVTAGLITAPPAVTISYGRERLPSENVHVWAEVRLPDGTWVPVEPTPGFELMGPSRSWAEQALGVVVAAWQWARTNVISLIVGVVMMVVLAWRRRDVSDLVATLTWRMISTSNPRRGAVEALRSSRSDRAWPACLARRGERRAAGTRRSHRVLPRSAATSTDSSCSRNGACTHPSARTHRGFPWATILSSPVGERFPTARCGASAPPCFAPLRNQRRDHTCAAPDG